MLVPRALMQVQLRPHARGDEARWSTTLLPRLRSLSALRCLQLRPGTLLPRPHSLFALCHLLLWPDTRLQFWPGTLLPRPRSLSALRHLQLWTDARWHLECRPGARGEEAREQSAL